ncbi:ribosome small subunit-dependent GTPase A [Anaerostipes faecalis]|uniref:ribosome small subunit-dependent GTPase A n=1 Tax=Anaerostipes faecalis TaxID=2738446 RepID=UPI003F0FAF5D
MTTKYRAGKEIGTAKAVISGKFRYEAKRVSDYPAVGDFVLFAPNANGQAVIQQILPRKSVFIRKAAGTSNQEQVVAANVDTVFLCMALNRDFNLRRMERYVSIAWDSGATPVIILTKCDLCEDAESRKREVEEVATGIDIITTSSMETDGYVAVLPYLKEGKTAALIGSSGVVKSTLINRLLGEDILATNGLRDDDKGRHTTTHRELMLLPGKGMIIDTPGMRELGMWNASDGLEKTFEDIEELTRLCRFRNCTHQTEPGCAVREALKNGMLSEERYLSWKKLTKENAWNEDNESYLAVKEKKFKEIARINKNRKKGRTTGS